MITETDIQKMIKRMKGVFVTKKEFKIEMKKVDYRFNDVDKRLNEIVDSIKVVINMVGDVSQKLDEYRKETGEILDNHEHRLDKLDDKVFSLS